MSKQTTNNEMHFAKAFFYVLRIHINNLTTPKGNTVRCNILRNNIRYTFPIIENVPEVIVNHSKDKKSNIPSVDCHIKQRQMTTKTDTRRTHKQDVFYEYEVKNKTNTHELTVHVIMMLCREL